MTKPEAGDELTPAQRLGRRFKVAREAAGWTQKAIAETLGVPQPRISELERGVTTPALARLYEIIDRLGLDDAEVLVRPKAERTDQRSDS